VCVEREREGGREKIRKRVHVSGMGDGEVEEGDEEEAI